jgi:hypothetical protein
MRLWQFAGATNQSSHGVTACVVFLSRIFLTNILISVSVFDMPPTTPFCSDTSKNRSND